MSANDPLLPVGFLHSGHSRLSISGSKLKPDTRTKYSITPAHEKGLILFIPGSYKSGFLDTYAIHVMATTP
jgi:hypothetical protein